jgi:hypothetical protein
MSVMISVDWDFFLWRAAEARDVRVVTYPGTPRERDVNGYYLFDWGHNENWSPGLQEVVWKVRWSELVAAGLDPMTVAGFRSPAPTDFHTALSARHPLLRGPLYVADSHALSYLAVAEVAACSSWPVDVVHFDAHADLGYGGDNETLDCGNWLLKAMHDGHVSCVTIVYPDWRDDRAETEVVSRARQTLGAERLLTLSWSEWASSHWSRVDPAIAVTVCRSSAWTPPWFDLAFAKFLEQWSTSAQCLDCAYPDHRPGAYHGCVPREWDLADDLTRFMVGSRERRD